MKQLIVFALSPLVRVFCVFLVVFVFWVIYEKKYIGFSMRV